MPASSENGLGFDGKIDQVVLNFTNAVTNAYLEDFEVIGYSVTAATITGTTVILDVQGDVQDTAAKPLVKFFPGRLSSGGSPVGQGQRMLTATASDGCPPVWELITGASLRAPLDVDYKPNNTATNPATLFVSFSEPVNVSAASPFHMSFDSGLCVSDCPLSTTWSTVRNGESLANLTVMTGTALCDTIGDYLLPLRFDNNFVKSWETGVKGLDGLGLSIRLTTTTAASSMLAVSGAVSIGFTYNDSQMDQFISNVSYCGRTPPVFNCSFGLPPLKPKVVATSLDLDGNGKIDTIQVLTRRWRLDITPTFSMGDSLQTFYINKQLRRQIDTLVMSNLSLWSLPGYTILSMIEEKGRVLLKVNETAVDTKPVASMLSYGGTLRTWTDNTLDAIDISVGDKACPVITYVKARGGTDQVYIVFSEDVNPASINSASFTSFVSNTFSSTPFTSGFLNESNVFIGTLPAIVTSDNFGANPLWISGLRSITQMGGTCGLRRNYVALTKLDITPPTIVRVLTRDYNGNGIIDGVLVEFSESVSDSSAMPFQFELVGYSNLTLRSSTLNDAFLEFNVNEQGGINTTAAPAFHVTLGGPLVDLSDNYLAPVSVICTDGVAPYPLFSKTGSNPGSGEPSKVTITFSEPVVNGSASEFSIFNQSIASFSTNGPVVTLSLGTPTSLSGNANLTVIFTTDTLGDSLLNPVPSFQIQAVDGVAPICGASSQTEDKANNGHIDQITLSCTEAVKGSGVGSFSVANYTVLNVTSARTPLCPGSATDCVLIFVQEKTYYDTGALPIVTYTASPGLTDLVGNPLYNSTIVVVDKTPPVVTRIVTQDANVDGKIDGFLLEFSEPMLSAEGLESNWVIPGFSPPVFNASAGTKFLYLSSSALVVHYDGGDTPVVQIANGGAKDLPGNIMVGKNVNSTDGVAPILLNISTTGGCKMNSVEITLSENISATTIDVHSFVIEMYNIANITTPVEVLPSGFRLYVEPYELHTPDFGNPRVSYDALSIVRDNGANALANFSGVVASDRVAPCMLRCLAHVGGSYVFVEFSEHVVAGVSNTTVTQLDFQLSNSSVSMNSSQNLNATSFLFFVAAPFIESDINFNSNQGKASLKPLFIHDLTNNYVSNSSCYVFNDDLVPPRLINAETVNSNGTDAMIDQIKLTFDDAVKDVTFNVLDWDVSNYNIASISTGTTVNDNIVYLNLALNTVPDTGATPNVTYTKPATAGASDRNLNLLDSTSLVAKDGAKPMLVSFQATILSPARGGNYAVATFSEPVTGFGEIPVGVSNFVYTNANGNAASIQNFTQTDGPDQIFLMQLNALALSDFGQDLVRANVWDAANLSSTTSAVFVTKGDQRDPVVLQAMTGDLDMDGQIDTLTVVFNESMLNTSFDISRFTIEAPYTLSNFVVNDDIVNFSVNGSIALDGAATPAFTYQKGVVADLNANLLQNFTTNTSDGVSPFLLDCFSTLPNHVDIQCQFSESVTAVAFSDFVLGGPLSNAAVNGTSALTSEIISFQLSRALVLSDFKGIGTVDLIADGNLVDVAANKGRPHQVRLRNTDVFAPNVTDALTRDTNCDGFVDAIEIIFNEGVIDTSVIASQFTVGGGLMFTGVVSTGATQDDSSILLVVGSNTVTTGGFSLSYSTGSLTDLSENRADAFSVTVRDGVGPALVGVTGTVDQNFVYLTFTAPITANSNINMFVLQNFSSSIASMSDANGQDNNVSFTLSNPLTPQDFRLPASIDPRLVVDADGNAACRVVALTNPDKTPPTVYSVATADENGDGFIDGFIFNFTEPLDETSLIFSDFSVTNYTVTGLNITGLPLRNLLKLSVAQKNGTTDASLMPQVSYVMGSLADRYGNKASSFSNMQSKDGAGPVIISAVGSGSSLILTFSEPIYNATNGTLFKLADVMYNAIVNGTSPNALFTISDKDGADRTLEFQMVHDFTAAEFGADTVGIGASISDVYGNQANSSFSVRIQRQIVLENLGAADPALTETQIILIAVLGGGGLLLLILAVVVIVVLKKKGGCKKKKDVAFDQNQIANEFDFGSAGSTEMTQSSKGAQRLEA